MAVVAVVVVVVGACVGLNRLLPKANLFAVENLDEGEVGATVVVGSGLLKDGRIFGLSVITSRRDGL